MNLNREIRIATKEMQEVEGDLIVDLSFASETPYERWWGIEVLDCKAQSVRLARLNDGAALLFNHDWNDLRGVHVAGSVKCDANNVLRGQVRITGATEKGRETQALVRTGMLSKTSIGYEIHKVIEQTTSKQGKTIERELDGKVFGKVLERSQREAPGDISAFYRQLDEKAGAFERADNSVATYRVTDWEPLENSLVTVPADPTVGVGRMAEKTQEPAAPETQQLTEQPQLKQETIMTDNTKTQEPVDIAAIEARASAGANARVQELLAIGDQFKTFDGVQNMVREALNGGESVQDFSKRLMKHIADKQTFKPEIGMSQKEAKKFSVVRAINAMLTKDWSKAGLEREASEAFAQRAATAGVQRQSADSFFIPFEVQKRDLTVASATGGGNMVATDLRPQDFIELLRSRNLLMGLGARMLTGLVGNADITRQTGAATGYWLGSESTAITESNQTVGLLQLRPKTLGAYTEISRLLLQQSTPDADMFVMDDLALVLANSLDVAGFNGSGAAGQPTGVLNTAGIGAFSGTTLGLSGLMDAQVDVAAANALTPNCAYVTTPGVASLLAQRQRFASTDTPLWNGNILDGNVLGFRGATSNNIPAATAIFGDFSQVIIAEWGALEIAANPYANFAAGITGIRAFHTVDIGVRTAGAFSAANTIT